MLFPEQQRREEKGEDSILHCNKGKEKRNLTRPAACRTFQFKGGSSRVHEMLSFKLKMNTPQPASHAGETHLLNQGPPAETLSSAYHVINSKLGS